MLRNYFFRQLFLGCLVTMTIHNLGADSRIILPRIWQIQPAKSVKTPPKENDWGKMNATDWRWTRPVAKGTLWQKAKRNEIHNLWYQQEIKIPAGWRDGHLFVDFRRIEGDAIVFWNGERVCELLRPGGEVDVSKYVKAGEENQLRVFLTRDYTDISRGFKDDLLRYTARGPRAKNLKTGRCGFGITAPVTLKYCPSPTAVKDVFVETSWRQKMLTVNVELMVSEALGNLTVKATVYNGKNKKVLEVIKSGVAVAPGFQTVKLNKRWENPITWELDRGYLYHMQVELIDNNKIIDRNTDIDFGFREVWIKDKTVYLNGHPIRWRVEWNSFGLTEKSIPFLKLMGRNCIYFQANPTSWWCDWSETPLYDNSIIDLLDKEGIAVFLPVPGICYIGSKLLENPKVQNDYKREMGLWLKRYRNHPSILGWIVGMNSFNAKDAIHPHTMGKRSNYKHSKAKVIEKAIEITKDIDPTRFVYSHADGNLGDIASGNNYPNFSPLQEREEYPLEWAKSGDMPYLAAETAAPYLGCFYKGKQFLFTEYASIYFGDEAYRKENVEGLSKTIELGLGNKGHGNTFQQALPYFPLYWDIARLFAVNMDKAWRTWGVHGWHYFNFGIGYGNPPGFKSKRPFNRYRSIREKITGRPDWVNPHYDIYRDAMQSLLIYIAGSPVHTDKTHAFFPGELIKKQIAAVWDGPEKINLKCKWAMKSVAGENVTHGTVDMELNPGDIKFVPIEITAPLVKKRTEYTLSLDVIKGSEKISEDKIKIQVFPKPEILSISNRIKVYGPKEKSSQWLERTGLKFEKFRLGESLDNVDLLIIGREALTPGMRLPYTETKLKDGLKVLVLEQKPEIWEAMGFKTIETMPRYVFLRDQDSPIFSGLKPEDFINWRGSPDLLPERKAARGYDTQHAPKWTNRHAIASVVLQIPQVVGFIPYLVAEFDLDYSPLMQFKYGKGSIYFCSLDLTGRVGTAPAATLLAHNLLENITQKQPSTKKTCYSGGIDDQRLLRKLYVGTVTGSDLTNPEQTVLVQGSGKQTYPEKAVEEFITSGGTVISLPQNNNVLKRFGFSTEEKTLYKVSVPEKDRLFSTIGPRLLRWRDALNVTTISSKNLVSATRFSDGVFVLSKKGRGVRLFMQLSSQLLENRYLDDAGKRENIQLSIARLNQLTARILTNAGVTPDRKIACRISELHAGPAYETLAFWHVLGPYPVKGLNQKQVLDKKFPGEENAVIGDTNPNLLYKRDDGVNLDFRKTVNADSKGFIDLSKPLNAYNNSVAYVTKTVDSPIARTALLRLGVDYFMKVWVNGKVVYELTQGHSSPKPNRHQIKIDLIPGKNIITIKILSGSKGFGFWANMSKPGITEQQGSGEKKQNVYLYDPELKIRDPYEYHYW